MWQKCSHMWCWYCIMWGWCHRIWEKKNRGTTEFDKSTVICDVDTAQYKDNTIKCGKKNKGTTKCDKSIVTCDVNTIQCEDGIIKYGKKK